MDRFCFPIVVNTKKNKTEDYANYTGDDGVTYIDIKALQDLKDKTTTNSIGSTYADLAEKYGAKVVTIDSFDETLSLVEHGRADATLNDNATFYYYQKVQPSNPFKAAFLTETPSKVAIPVRKAPETKNLLTAINKALDELKESGELAELSKKYFGEDLTK